jgi:hypothetical protein
VKRRLSVEDIKNLRDALGIPADLLIGQAKEAVLAKAAVAKL